MSVFDFFNPNLYFILEKKTLDDLKKDVAIFGQKIQKRQQEEIGIYIENLYHFCVAFFGCLEYGISPFILASKNNEMPIIDEDEFEKISKEDFSPSVAKKQMQTTFFLQTSGSIGERKKISKTLKHMIEEAQFLQRHFDIKSDLTFASSVLHQHLFGMTFKIFIPFLSGAKIHSSQILYLQDIQTLQSENLVFISSPAFLQIFLQYPLEFKTHLLISAGSKLDTGVYKIISNITEIYGSTETGAIAYCNNGEEFMPFEGSNIGTDERGALNFRSKWCDFFQTNDKIKFDGKSFRILGRLDHMVKFKDKRLSLDSIEKELQKHPFISAIKVKQLGNKSRLCAILKLTQEGKKGFLNLGKRGIINNIQNFLSNEHKNIIRSFKIVSELPSDMMGKISYENFKKTFESQTKLEFSVIELSEHFGKFKSLVSEEFFCFNGHFLDFPLVPGFMEIGFIFELTSYLGIELEEIYEIENVKFLKFLRPFEELTVEITKNQENTKIYFKIFSNQDLCTQGRFKFKEKIAKCD